MLPSYHIYHVRVIDYLDFSLSVLSDSLPSSPQLRRPQVPHGARREGAVRLHARAREEGEGREAVVGARVGRALVAHQGHARHHHRRHQQQRRRERKALDARLRRELGEQPGEREKRRRREGISTNL